MWLVRLLLVSSVAVGLFGLPCAVSCCASERDAKRENTADETHLDKEKLQGAWKLVYGEYNGGLIPTSIEAKFVFSGKECRVETKGPGGHGARPFTIDATKSPREIDALGGEYRDRGIYMFVGDLLILAYRTNGERPSEFKSKRGSLVQLYVLRREDK